MEKSMKSLFKYPLVIFIIGMAVISVGAFFKIQGNNMTFVLSVGLVIEVQALLVLAYNYLHRKTIA